MHIQSLEWILFWLRLPGKNTGGPSQVDMPKQQDATRFQCGFATLSFTVADCFVHGYLPGVAGLFGAI
jgi:hypothetical protein